MVTSDSLANATGHSADLGRSLHHKIKGSAWRANEPGPQFNFDPSPSKIWRASECSGFTKQKESCLHSCRCGQRTATPELCKDHSLDASFHRSFFLSLMVRSRPSAFETHDCCVLNGHRQGRWSRRFFGLFSSRLSWMAELRSATRARRSHRRGTDGATGVTECNDIFCLHAQNYPKRGCGDEVCGSTFSFGFPGSDGQRPWVSLRTKGRAKVLFGAQVRRQGR